MAECFFLRIAGLAGAGPDGQTEVLSWSRPADAANGRSDFSFSKRIDAASAEFAAACRGGQSFALAIFTGCRDESDTEPYLRFTMTEVRIVRIAAGEAGEECVTLSCAGIVYDDTRRRASCC